MRPRQSEQKDWLIDYLLALDYRINKKGVCFGVSNMAMQAMLADDLDAFDFRINRLMDQMDPATLKERLKKVRTKIADSKNNPSIDDEEQFILEIPAFFEGILVYQQPFHFPNLFVDLNSEEIDWNNIQFPTANNTELTLPVVISKKLTDQKGVHKADSFSGIYDEDDLIIYFNSLLESIKQNGYSSPFSIIFGNSGHAITVGYDYKTSQWTFVNTFNLPSQRFATTEELVAALQEGFGCKKEDSLSLTSEMYVTNNNLEHFKQVKNTWKNSTAWQQIHDTKAKAKDVDSTESSWLYSAAKIGDTATVDTLLNDGAEVNRANRQGVTPLFIAAQNGHISTVRKLLDKEADIEIARFDGVTPLYIAAKTGHYAVIKAFLELLLPNKTIDSQSCPDGSSPLSAAVSQGFYPIVKLLLESGSDLNKTTVNGISIILLAAKNKQIEVLKLLIEKGALPNPLRGDSPLAAAVKNGDAKMVGYLLEVGAKYVPGLLNLAVTNNDIETVKLLLASGANPNERFDGFYPLHVAVEQANAEIVNELIKHAEIQLDPISVEDTTPLYIAAQRGHTDIVDLLANRGANTSYTLPNGTTPLMIAKRNGHLATAKRLDGEGKNNQSSDLTQAQEDEVKSLIMDKNELLGTIEDDTTLDMGTKLFFLEKALTEDGETFLKSLEKLFHGFLNGYKERDHLKFIRLLKLINDLVFDNDIKYGHGVKNALGHYLNVSENKEAYAESVKRLIVQQVKELKQKDEAVIHGQMQNRKTIHDEKPYTRSIKLRMQLNLPPTQISNLSKTSTSSFFAEAPIHIQDLAEQTGVGVVPLQNYFNNGEDSKLKKITNLKNYLRNIKDRVEPGLTLEEVIKLSDTECLNLKVAYPFVKDGLMTMDHAKKLTNAERDQLAATAHSSQADRKAVLSQLNNNNNALKKS